MIQKELRKKFKEYMATTPITKDELSKAVGISKQTIYSFLRGGALYPETWKKVQAYLEAVDNPQVETQNNISEPGSGSATNGNL